MIALTLLLLAAEPVCTESVTNQAPDVPGVSVKLAEGEPAPYRGRLLSLTENCERGKATMACSAELADAKTYVWLPRTALAVLIGSSAAGLVTTVLTIVLAVMR